MENIHEQIIAPVHQNGHFSIISDVKNVNINIYQDICGLDGI